MTADYIFIFIVFKALKVISLLKNWLQFRLHGSVKLGDFHFNFCIWICISVLLYNNLLFHSYLNICFLCPSLQVKVMVRVCPVSQSDAAESSSFLKVDPRKKQITIMDPSANQTPSTPSQKRAAANQVPPKMFTFDAAFPPDASQVRENVVAVSKSLTTH